MSRSVTAASRSDIVVEHQRAQCLDIVGQVLHVVAWGIRHAQILRGDGRFVNRLHRLNTRPIEAIEQRRELNR